jgi:Polyketide cyclase / dehydrase and lipid transport
MTWIIILAVIALFLFWVSRRPGEFSISRSIDINAPPSAVFPEINNLKAMNTWNPWAGQDPKSVIAYEGAEEGPGAVYTWNGGKMGQGRFTIQSSTPSSEVKSRLEMIKPMRADNQVVFSIVPNGDVTRVTWAMSGHSSFMVKLMHLVFSPERMVGSSFETGLASLKAKVEKARLH